MLYSIYKDVIFVILFNRYPGGKRRAVTMSFDDGYREDEKLIEIFDHFGIRGTFHINSGLLHRDIRVDADEVAKIYKNHEISAHGFTHANFDELSESEIRDEIEKDLSELLHLSGREVHGMSYPNGKTSDKAVAVAKSLGIAYSRTTVSTPDFSIPEDFLYWHPTCHHLRSEEAAERFLASQVGGELLCIWGHSTEFERDKNWELIERVCEKLGACEDVWSATCIELCDYVCACRALRISPDEKTIENPTDIDVWFTVGGKTTCIKAKETIHI